MKGRIIGEHTDTEIVVDQSTGEILSKTERKRRSTTVYEKAEKNYIKLYSDGLQRLLRMPPWAMPLLAEMVDKGKYGNVISLTGEERKRVCSDLGWTGKTLSNHLTEMIGLGALRRLGNGEYMIDPHLFSKGKETDVKELCKEWDNAGDIDEDKDKGAKAAE